MKVAVLANCQGESIAQCIGAMTSGTTADAISFMDIANGKQGVPTLLGNYDLIFSQTFLKPHVPDAMKHRVFYFPNIIFPGFHPDMTYVRGHRKGGDKTMEVVPNALIMYHSAIALVGYLQGLSLEQVANLFNPDTYSRLGYFDMWNSARQDLITEGHEAGLPLGALFNRWAQRGCFMYSINHPHLHVMADVTRGLLAKAKIDVVSQNPENYLDDPLRGMSVWPLYPSVAERLGLHGDYMFTRPHPQGPITLQQFLYDAFSRFSDFEMSSLEPVGFKLADYQARLGFSPEAEKKIVVPASANPYSTAHKEQFWKNSVATVSPIDVDPVFNPNLVIGPTDRIATAGSCFAQNIARTLSRTGYNYFVSEVCPDDMTELEAKERNYGVYSARYGNIYTARQLVQLTKRISGTFIPQDEAWVRRDGRLVDPFRPQIEPLGFADLDALRRSRQEHFTAVARMFQDMDIFVFTLGLTEGWRSRRDGAVFPLAPGVAGGTMDFDKYEFINFTADDVVDDLHQFLDWLSAANPKCRIILTVSPVPLIATYEPRHALVATTYSKSVLRVAADTISRSYKHVEYFPSYEIITGAFNHGAYYEGDLRNVTEDGVAHVMRVFMDRMTTSGAAKPNGPAKLSEPAPVAKEPAKSRLFDIVCDEEAIANF